MSHQAELKSWLESVSAESDADYSAHTDDLVKHGLTKFLLNDVAAEDWAEIIKPVGPRIVIRRAAGNVFLQAELGNLKSLSERIRAERDQVVTQGAQVREELEKAQTELHRIDTDLTKVTQECQIATTKSTLGSSEIATLSKEREALEAEIAKIQDDVARAIADKESAVKQKEDAINRAIQLGVSAQNSSGPVGYGFQPAPAAAAQPPPQRAPPPATFSPAPAPAPSGPLPLEQNPWFHGSIGRPQCEALLMGATCQPGSFVVRASTRGDNSYSLSVRDNTGAKVKHFKIDRAGAAWRLALKVSDGQTFNSVASLVAHYGSIGSFSGVKLGVPAPGGGKPAAAPAASTPKGSFCGKCGTPYTPGERFCGACGAPL